jgi:hypothetical protein
VSALTLDGKLARRTDRAYDSAMKRAALALVLAACSASSNDFPPLAEGGGTPGISSGGGGTGTVRDAGTGDGGASGGLIQGRVCIVNDLRNPTLCDTTKDASVVKVTLGTRTPTTGPDPTGHFTIVAPSGSPVWHASGLNFISSVIPYGTDPTIPIVPDLFYGDVLRMNGGLTIQGGQGSVLARVVSNGSPVANVAAATNLTSNSITLTPLYDTKDGLVWSTAGPTLASGAVWFPLVDVTSASGRITFTPQGGTPVITRVDNVEDQAITFVTQDLQ